MVTMDNAHYNKVLDRNPFSDVLWYTCTITCALPTDHDDVREHSLFCLLLLNSSQYVGASIVLSHCFPLFHPEIAFPSQNGKNDSIISYTVNPYFPPTKLVVETRPAPGQGGEERGRDKRPKRAKQPKTYPDETDGLIFADDGSQRDPFASYTGSNDGGGGGGGGGGDDDDSHRDGEDGDGSDRASIAHSSVGSMGSAVGGEYIDPFAGMEQDEKDRLQEEAAAAAGHIYAPIGEG